jgi:hypothetical protein
MTSFTVKSTNEKAHPKDRHFHWYPLVDVLRNFVVEEVEILIQAESMPTALRM